MDVLVLHVIKYADVEVDAIPTKENYLIVDSGGDAYGRDLGHGFKTTISIHIPRWCVMYYPVQWDVELETLGLIFLLVHNDGHHE